MRVAVALLFVELSLSGVASADPDGASILKAAAHAMGRFDSRNSIELTGTVDFEGRTGSYRQLVRVHDGAFVSRAKYKLFGEADGYDGRRRWIQDRSGGTHDRNAPFTRAESITLAWLRRRGYLQLASGETESARKEQIDGRPATVLTLHPPGGNPLNLAFDDANHLLVRAQRERPISTITETYGDYRRVGRMKFPFKIEIEESGDRQEVHVKRYRIAGRTSGSMFAPPTAPRDTFISGAASIALDGSSFAVVPARINGHDYDFILDTGGHNIITPAVAAELGLQLDGSGTAGGSGPGREPTSDTVVNELKFGSATMRNQHFTVLGLGKAVERKNKPPLAGILGLEVFERMTLTLDEPNGRLTIDRKRATRRCTGDRVPLLFDEDQPTVQGKIDGVPGLIGIDIGNGGIPIVFWKWAEANGIAERFRHGTRQIGNGVGGSNTTSRTSHHEIAVGTSVLSDIDVNYAESRAGAFSSSTDAANVGRSLLQKYLVRFDYARGQMCVTPQGRRD